MECINEVINLCNKTGKLIPRWTQGAGSNISVKDLDHNILYIKGSGLRLEEVVDSSKVAKIDLPSFIKDFNLLASETDISSDEKKYAELIDTCGKIINTPIRASMETGFHAVLNFRYVIHIHSLVSIAIQDPKWCLEFEKMLQTLPESLTPHAQIKSMMPGLNLSMAIKKHTNAKIIFLENHGVILSTNENPELMLENFYEWEEKILEQMKWNKKLFDEKNLHMKWKVFTPDAAVFEDKILECTHTHKKTQDKGQIYDDNISLKAQYLSDSLITKEKNLRELFLASAILYQWNPDMKVLNQDYIERVSQLPTENFRKG